MPIPPWRVLLTGLAFLAAFAAAAFSPADDPADGFEALVAEARRRAAASGEAHRLEFGPSGGPLRIDLRSRTGEFLRHLENDEVTLSRRPDWIDFLPTGEARLPGTCRVGHDGRRDPGPLPDLDLRSKSREAWITLDLPRGGVARVLRLRNP